VTDPNPPSRRPAAIAGARVWDGNRFDGERTVIIDGSLIGTEADDAEVIDCTGGYLLPGLIDAHVHLGDRSTLEHLADYGVTTALDMATWPPERLNPLRNVPGVTDIRSPGASAIGPAGPHSHIPTINPESVLHTPADARAFVDARASENVDYIKIVLEAPGEGGPERDSALALVEAAHAIGKAVIAHAASTGAYQLALDIAADVITHVPLGEPVADSMIEQMVDQHTIIVPTLTMMEQIATNNGVPQAFKGSLLSVNRIHGAGVPVLAGTDANTQAGVPAQIPHGESLHHELELLTQAGLTAADALRAATTLPASHFDLPDRGTVTAGRRADLILLNSNPLEDIRATRDLVRAWFAGIERAPSRTAGESR
jgi:imidazolonepropionase-like amidohydrolase